MKKKIENPNISELARVLSEEVSLYEKYKEILAQDQEAMGRLKVEILEANNKTKATILLKIQTLEQARGTLVSRIAKEKGIAEEGIRIHDLCKQMSREESSYLMQLRNRLLEIVDEIRKIQFESKAIVQSSLTWIDGSMRQLRNLLSPSGTYNARGKVGSPNNFSGHVVENKA